MVWTGWILQQERTKRAFFSLFHCLKDAPNLWRRLPAVASYILLPSNFTKMRLTVTPKRPLSHQDNKNQLGWDRTKTCVWKICTRRKKHINVKIPVPKCRPHHGVTKWLLLSLSSDIQQNKTKKMTSQANTYAAERKLYASEKPTNISRILFFTKLPTHNFCYTHRLVNRSVVWIASLRNRFPAAHI